MNLGGVTTLQRAFVLVVLILGTILSLPGGRLQTTLGRAAAVCVFVACTVVSYLRFAAVPITPIGARTMIGLALMLMIVTAFALCALLAPADTYTRQRRLRCALFSPVCFVALNLGLYLAGFRFPATPTEQKTSYGSSQLLGLMHVHVTRVNLPLNPGVNGGGQMGGLALVICVALAYCSRGRLRGVAVSGAIMSLVTILLADSRGALIFAFVTLVVMMVLPRWTRRIAATIPVMLLIGPAIILFVLGQLSGLSASLSRTGSDFETATGRQAVWSTVLRFLSHPHVQDLVGYGAYGQVRSGVGFQYSYLFPYASYPQFSNTQNIVLQTILEVGYVGLAVFLVFLMVSVNSARRLDQSTGTPESTALLAALIVLSIIGADEALPGLAGVYLLVSVIVLACAAIRVPSSTRVRPKALDHAMAPHLTANAPSMSVVSRALAR
jgi:O-antigen ligase